MYALKRGGAATAAAANASSRCYVARRALCLARYTAAKSPGAAGGSGGVGAIAVAGGGGGGGGYGLRRRAVVSLSSRALGAPSASSREVASWTPPEARRFGAVVVGESVVWCGVFGGVL